ncbi:hypothetical protein [Terasakiella pusilla]|uniref:hypothetical protein n=1 Tax=Terasakiella pusilla TaxID=64973 RepID=UPI003AA84649
MMENTTMSKDKTDLHDLAAQYMQLWQKQIMSQSNERMMQDALKTSQTLNEQMGEALKGFDSPEKIQNWMTTWADTWKAQIEDAQGKQNANPFWPPSPADASGHHNKHVAELEKRIAALEERVLSLESELKAKS